jgi:hypothetical protein
MKERALDRFRTEFRRWVAAHNKAKGFTTNADELVGRLEERLGVECLLHIGAAFLNGWLETERGYFVREADLGPDRHGQFTITHQGGGNVAPCWELFVQLADYGWLRTVGERHHQRVRLEDRLMDLTVQAGSMLVLYVEQKTTSDVSERLLSRMRHYGTTGFRLDDPDKGNDPLRKAKYLLRTDAHPLYLGLSAINYQRLFRVEYQEANRFRLVNDDRAFATVLAEHSGLANDEPPTRSPVDPLASEIEQTCPDVWISVGSGQTAYNFYVPGPSGDALIIGVYESGEVWTDIAALGSERAARFAMALARTGVAIDVEKKWCIWEKDGRKVNLGDVDAVAVAEAVNTITLDTLL